MGFKMKIKIKDLVMLSLKAKEIVKDIELLVKSNSWSYRDSLVFDYSEASEDAIKYLDIAWQQRLAKDSK
jgi:hypothetical protein